MSTTDTTRPQADATETAVATRRERYQQPQLEPAGRLEPRLQGSPPEPPPWP